MRCPAKVRLNDDGFLNAGLEYSKQRVVASDELCIGFDTLRLAEKEAHANQDIEEGFQIMGGFVVDRFLWIYTTKFCGHPGPRSLVYIRTGTQTNIKRRTVR